MNGIGKNFFAIALMLINLLAGLAHAELTIRAEINESNVSQSEAIMLDVIVQTDSGDELLDPKQPDLSQFEFSSPSISSQSSTQWINGKVTRSKQKQYHYELYPKKNGLLTIGPFTIVDKGKVKSTNPIQINVGNATTSKDQDSDKHTQSQEQNPNNESVFIHAELSSKEAYVGQAVDLTYYLYSRVDGINIEDLKFPDLPNVQVEESDEKIGTSLGTKTLNGQMYQVYKLKSYRLIPSLSGDIVIDPMVAKIGSGVNSFFSDFDSFFGRMSPFQPKRFLAKSKELTLHALSLPQPMPSDFTGSVGDFTMTTELSPQDLNAGTSSTLRVTITGHGEILGRPTSMGVDPSIELKENLSLATVVKTQSDTKSYEWYLMPRKAGEKSAGSVVFTYFDPDKKTYKTLRQDVGTLTVSEHSSTDTESLLPAKSLEDDPIRPVSSGSHKFTLFFVILIALVSACILLLIYRFSKSKRRAYSQDVQRDKQSVEFGSQTSQTTEAKSDVPLVVTDWLSELDKAHHSPSQIRSLLQRYRENNVNYMDTESVLELDALIRDLTHALYAPDSNSELTMFDERARKILSHQG